MAIIISREEISEKEFKRAREDYDGYIKLTIDIEKQIVALGGEYHADAEEILLKQGSRQDDIWGGGFNLETKRFETNAIINIRGDKNDSTEILDYDKREKFLRIARRVLKKYVK